MELLSLGQLMVQMTRVWAQQACVRLYRETESPELPVSSVYISSRGFLIPLRF